MAPSDPFFFSFYSLHPIIHPPPPLLPLDRLPTLLLEEEYIASSSFPTNRLAPLAHPQPPIYVRVCIEGTEYTCPGWTRPGISLDFNLVKIRSTLSLVGNYYPIFGGINARHARPVSSSYPLSFLKFSISISLVFLSLYIYIYSFSSFRSEVLGFEGKARQGKGFVTPRNQSR